MQPDVTAQATPRLSHVETWPVRVLRLISAMSPDHPLSLSAVDVVQPVFRTRPSAIHSAGFVKLWSVGLRRDERFVERGRIPTEAHGLPHGLIWRFAIPSQESSSDHQPQGAWFYLRDGPSGRLR